MVLALLCAGWYGFFTPAPVSCKVREAEDSFCLVELDLLRAAVWFAPTRFAFDRGGEACGLSSRLGKYFLPPLEALRKDAGVILGESSSSDSSSSTSESEVGVTGRLEGSRPLRPLTGTLARRGLEVAVIRADLVTAFRAPGFATLRCRLTVVVLVDLSEPFTVRLKAVGRSLLETVNADDRFMARSSRDAICLECSAASNSAFSRAAFVFESCVLAFEYAGSTLRFLGESVARSDLARADPRKSCSLRLVPAMRADAMDLSSTGFFGFGPRTPRQDSVPQRHS